MAHVSGMHWEQMLIYDDKLSYGMIHIHQTLTYTYLVVVKQQYAYIKYIYTYRSDVNIDKNKKTVQQPIVESIETTSHACILYIYQLCSENSWFLVEEKMIITKFEQIANILFFTKNIYLFCIYIKRIFSLQN